MELLLDYIPIVCFFVAYKFYGIFVATAVTMAVSVIQITLFRILTGQFKKLHLITAGVVLVFGGATLVFHQDMFIKWKTTVIYWAMGIALLVSQFIGKKNLIQRMLDQQLHMPQHVWSRVNLSWVCFMLVMGGINLYVFHHFSTNTWVNFKLFGTLGLTLLFMIVQGLCLSRYIKDNTQP